MEFVRSFEIYIVGMRVKMCVGDLIIDSISFKQFVKVLLLSQI